MTESSAVRPGTEGLLVDRVCALDVTGGHELGVVVGTGPLWHPRPGACAYTPEKVALQFADVANHADARVPELRNECLK